MVIITTFQAPESPIRSEQRNTVVILDKKNLGSGTLFISERTISWQKEGIIGFSLDYDNITLHAVSKDPNVYERECIYILTDPHINIDGSDTEPATDHSDDESEADVSELILVSDEPSFVQNIYESIKICQELNPDPADFDDDEHLFEDAEELDQPENGDEVNHLVQRLYLGPNQHENGDDEFEDAD